MTEFSVRDRRANNRFFVDNALLRGGWGAVIGPYGIAVYDAIALHADADNQSAYPSHQLIADLTGMSRPTVVKAVNQLEGLNIIAIERTDGRSHTYYLLDQSEWKPVKEVYTTCKGGLQVDVNEIYTPCKGGLQVPVNGVYTNNTQGTKPSEQDPDEHGADAPCASESETEPEQLKTKTPAQEMFEALATVCAWDLDLITEKQRGALNQTGKLLREMRGQTVTPTDVLAFGEWWRANDWRGKQGEFPRPDQVRAEWGRFKNWQRERAKVQAKQDETRRQAEARRAELETEEADVDPDLALARKTWIDACEQLAGGMTRGTYATYIAPLEVAQPNGAFRLIAPTKEIREWVDNRVRRKIEFALQCVVGREVQVEFVMEETQ